MGASSVSVTAQQQRREQQHLASLVSGLDRQLAALEAPAALVQTVSRWRADAGGLLFHLAEQREHPVLLAILGGTGTGKSTLVNRLLEANCSATSFRRTFTAGPVAIARDAGAVPARWLGVEAVCAGPQDLPVRGRGDALIVVPLDRELTGQTTLIDTPDLDGDQPLHHAQADRAFRWAEAILFLVTPEKYQMTELLPYYRLARRYALPALFVMNKCETAAMLEDFAKQLGQHGWPEARVFAIPRDDAAYEAPGDANLAALRTALSQLQVAEPTLRTAGVLNRTADLLDRLEDQILTPLRAARREADRLIDALESLEAPAISIDVNPITRQLQRRLQQRSVLYLMGPGRVLDRIRQVPGLLVRLPRATWDLLAQGRTGKMLAGIDEQPAATDAGGVPDFGAALANQFTVVQSRIDDAIRSTPTGQRWITDGEASYRVVRIDPAAAGAIAREELADLTDWLERRWNATPRDTAVLMKLLRHLPGGQKLTRWSEAAPYLLAIVAAAHHAFFGPLDLAVLGGWGLATWIIERLSNEVASRTRYTNRRIAQRFAQLAHEQIERACGWLDRQAPAMAKIQQLERSANEVADASRQ